MKTYLSVLFILISIFSVEANAAENPTKVDTDQVFLKANEAYANSDYISAVSYYENIISSGVINGYIYYTA